MYSSEFSHQLVLSIYYQRFGKIWLLTHKIYTKDTSIGIIAKTHHSFLYPKEKSWQFWTTRVGIHIYMYVYVFRQTSRSIKLRNIYSCGYFHPDIIGHIVQGSQLSRDIMLPKHRISAAIELSQKYTTTDSRCNLAIQQLWMRDARKMRQSSEYWVIYTTYHLYHMA